MINKNKYTSIALTILSVFLFSCNSGSTQLCGFWESILIENKSTLFTKTLPSSLKGEVLLTFSDDNKFTWINKSEKLNLSGKYKTERNKICFNIDGENNPLYVEFKFLNEKLILNTDDGFTFTFTRR